MCGYQQTIRLIRQISPAGKVRVLNTNLLDMHRYPAATFRDLYHRRWRLEEAFKRLKHRMALEHLSGLSQLVARHDFDAKILIDNLHTLCCPGATQEHDVEANDRINRSYAITAPKPVLSAALLGLRWAKAALNGTLHLVAHVPIACDRIALSHVRLATNLIDMPPTRLVEA